MSSTRDRRPILAVLGAVSALLSGCRPEPSSGPPPAPIEELRLAPAEVQAADPRVAAHRRRIAQALAQPNPILTLDGLAPVAARAQAIAVADPEVQKAARDLDGRPFRLEVFQVYPLRPSDLNEATAACRERPCQRVEIYDYARNRSYVLAVDPDAGRVVARGVQQDAQPELPPHLKELAIAIALGAPEVAEALGGEVLGPEQVQMASTKTALNGTRCERSRHLCVAPTLVQGKVAIWAIVDLTDLRLVGVRWTDLGRRDDPPPTEQGLQDAVLERDWCEKVHRLERDGWQLTYTLTASDGLRVGPVYFQGAPVLASVKLVDWHVNYSAREGFGYSDAVGCPTFSSAAVVPFEPPRIEPIAGEGQPSGFRLSQEFRSPGWPRACNYSYRQAVEFYADGSFRPTVASIGAGCGNDGTYRPVLRIEFPPGPFAAELWQDGGWRGLTHESWWAPEAAVAADGARLKLRFVGRTWSMIPGRGQFDDGGRGDQEWLYLTAHPPGRDEGQSELLTVGPCCNTDHRQGPEKYVDDPPEPLAAGAVLWYVPQLENDDRPGREYCWAKLELIDGVFRPRAFPCTAGPWFRPEPP